MEPEKYLEGLSKGITPIIQEIYSDIFPKVTSFIKKNRGTEEDAQDIFQKALMQIIARYKIRPFTITLSFGGYFFTVCKNLWRKELKRRKREVTNLVSLEQGTKGHDMALGALEQEKWEIFQEKLQDLSENCRVMLRYFFDRKPYGEIMELMGYNSDNVVRQRVFKCKKKLMELVKRDYRYIEIKK